MARFKTEGIDELIDTLIRIGEGAGELADEMLMAGAEEVKISWQYAAAYHGHKDTGDMIDAIGYARKPRTISGIRQIDIYPQGKDRKGVRNAEKAFILHYGTSKKPGSHWVDTADDLSGPRVEAAMKKTHDNYLERKDANG